MDSTSAVLNLPELLSEILLYLPFEEILRARRVSHRFKQVIDTDPELLWETWRSPTPPTSARKRLQSQIPAEDAPYSNEITYFEPFRPFFERTLINIDEWTTEPNPLSPPLRIMQKQFIRKSLADFLAKNADNLTNFYITRPPLKRIESSIRVITATSGRRSSLQSNLGLDKGFTITSESGITVDSYLKALLDCLEASWGHITIVQPPPPKYIPPGEETGDFTANLKRKHRLEAQLFTMKKEYYDDDDDDYYEIDENGERRRKQRLSSREEWERGAMSSTLIIKVHYTVLPSTEPVRAEGLLAGLWRRVFG